MSIDDLDRILATEEELMPSSGFVATVMGAVEQEAAAPPPIPFPWKRAVPGMVLTAGVLGWGGVELVRHALPAMARMTLPVLHLTTGLTLPLERAGWVAAALGISLAGWIFSRRMAGGSGLL